MLACFTVLWGTWFPKISELATNSKVTVGAPFYNNVAIPVALLLLLLTAVGPLLAWRKTSFESLKRNFFWPAMGGVAVGVIMTIFGVRPWKDISYLYSLMAGMLGTLVILTVCSEFVRGGRVISRHTGQGLFASIIHLWHRNTRRYGGYIVHFGVAVVVIGIAGAAFNTDVEKEMSFGDKMTLGKYTLVCNSYTQDDNANASSEWAVMDLYRGDNKLTTLYPERRVYKASNQPQTIPRIYSTWLEDFLLVSDVYVVYEGVNQDNGHPIIKAHLNPMVPWIWFGWLVMVFGTIIALIPNAQAMARVTVPARVPVSVGAGD